MSDSLERIGITSDVINNLRVSDRDRKRMHSPSPVWGRYDDLTAPLEGITSEYQWVKRRFWGEVEYLIALGDELKDYTGKKKKIISNPFSEGERASLRRLYDDGPNGLYNEETFQLFKLADDTIHQDVVAMEMVGVYKLSEIGFDPKLVEAAFHFARTSNDINSLVACSMIRDYLQQIYIPLLIKMEQTFVDKAKAWGGGPFAAQTHGQYAVPTTLRKVMANFADGLRQGMDDFLESGGGPYRLQAKFGGPVGNESGLKGAYPDHDWESFNREFIESLGFDWAKMADQDEFNIRNIRLFDAMVRVNDLLEKYASDFWDYTSRGVLIKIPKKEESGSSSMAAKVNPWRTEGGWELFGFASDELQRCHDLTKYMQQGDLKRSMIRRLLGEPFGKIMVGVNRLMQDLSKYDPMPEQIGRELDEHPEMAAFYLQAVFRREGVYDAYDRIKDLTMGKRATKGDLHNAIHTLVTEGLIEEDIDREVKSGMEPENNIGYANEWADDALGDAENMLRKLKNAYGIQTESK